MICFVKSRFILLKARPYPRLDVRLGSPSRLRDELLNGEIFTSLKEAQILTERWRREYNEFRPHSALNYQPPAPPAVLPEVQGHTPVRLTY